MSRSGWLEATRASQTVLPHSLQCNLCLFNSGGFVIVWWLQAKLPYHSSAILAAALDTMTLMYRLKGNDLSLPDLCADLGANGRKVACAGLCLPFSLNSDADLIDCLDKWEGPLLKSITPQCSIGA